jgi:hypothetical protein
VRFRVALGNLDHRWELEGLSSGETGLLELPLALPEEAWLDDAAEDYVTDLVTTVDVDTERIKLPVLHLAWTNGRVEDPELWTRQQMRDRAPNGVLDAALRTHAIEPHARLLPWVGDPGVLQDTGVAR